MHLVSRRDQRVPVAGREFTFAEGESIRTEYSYKYSLNDLRALAGAGGWEVEAVWTDGQNYFSVLDLTAR